MPAGRVNSIMPGFPVSVLVMLADSFLGAVGEEVSDISDNMCKTLCVTEPPYGFCTEWEGLEGPTKSLCRAKVLAIVNIWNIYF